MQRRPLKVDKKNVAKHFAVFTTTDAVLTRHIMACNAGIIAT